MSSCLLPILIAVFGSFLWFGVATTEVSSPPEPAVAVDEAIVSTPATANAEAFLLAVAARDIETARQYACDVNADEMLAEIDEGSVIDIQDLICSDEGDNTVRCTFESDLGVFNEITEIEMTFSVDENNLVCEVSKMTTGLDDVPSE